MQQQQFICEGCNEIFEPCRNSFSRFCSNKCQQIATFEKKYNLFLANDDTVFKHHQTIRRALIQRDGDQCNECNITEWRGQKIVFEIEHNDGNSENKSPSNLRLLCPNCHSQTSTFKGRNRGNGRFIRRLRYAEGQSY